MTTIDRNVLELRQIVYKIYIYNFNISAYVGLLHEIKMCLNETYSKE